MKKVSGILWGIVLVAVGVILTLNAFGVANVDIFFDGWWTLFIIVPCVIGLALATFACWLLAGAPARACP